MYFLKKGLWFHPSSHNLSHYSSQVVALEYTISQGSIMTSHVALVEHTHTQTALQCEKKNTLNGQNSLHRPEERCLWTIIRNALFLPGTAQGSILLSQQKNHLPRSECDWLQYLNLVTLFSVPITNMSYMWYPYRWITLTIKGFNSLLTAI